MKTCGISFETIILVFTPLVAWLVLLGLYTWQNLGKTTDVDESVKKIDKYRESFYQKYGRYPEGGVYGSVDKYSFTEFANRYLRKEGEDNG